MLAKIFFARMLHVVVVDAAALGENASARRFGIRLKGAWSPFMRTCKKLLNVCQKVGTQVSNVCCLSVSGSP